MLVCALIIALPADLLYAQDSDDALFNDQKTERFMASYDSPFARHWNSKRFERYIAARIPANLIPKDARWLSVRIDMSKQDEGIHFREIGTHDLDMPQDY